MARCLVTGHKGYIGSSVYARLKDAGHEVMGIDLVAGHDILRELKPDTDGKFHPHWFNFKPEYIFHLAAIPRVAYSVEHPVHVIENNVLSSLYILEFARAVDAKRVIYSSSSSVVGDGQGPENPYGASKYMPESMCGVWSRLYGVDTVCLRYFNVYSPDQKAEGPYATAIANWMQFIRDDKDPFITGNGEQRRDMAHKLDVVSANLFCMEHDENFAGSWFDVGTGDNVSLNQMKEIAHRFFPQVKFDYISERLGDVMTTKADISPLTSLGWLPKHEIESGVAECFSLLKEELS
jgi:nucleoside-diphosphate-sugar epimerase